MLDKVKLNVIQPKDKVQLGCFEIEAIHVNHSIPDALALAICHGHASDSLIINSNLR